MSENASQAVPEVVILIAEDSRTQAAKLQYLLESNNFKTLLAENGKKALNILETQLPTLIISDIVMPEMDGYELCTRVKSDPRTMHTPVILLTTLSRIEDVLEGLECGADYFITKPYGAKYLLASIQRIIDNPDLHQGNRQRVGSEIVVAGKRRRVTSDQQQTLSLLLSTYEAAVQANDDLAKAKYQMEKLNAHLEELVDERTSLLSHEIGVRQKSEERVKRLNTFLLAIRGINELITHEKDPAKLATGICHSLVKRRGDQDAMIFLTKDDGKLQVFGQSGLVSEYAVEGAGDIAARLPGCCREASPDDKLLHHISDRREVCKDCPWRPADLKGDVICTALRHSGASFGYISVTMDHLMATDEENLQLFREMTEDISAAFHNIEQNKLAQQALKEREMIQMELRQAQKMEAVGRLAGGVAHDFNNMLGVILGYSDLALEALEEENPLHGFLAEIRLAGQRSADLARQLLAFSSRQLVSPKVINLNQTVADMKKMLGRLIGEDIDLTFDQGEDLWDLLIDPSQVNQVLANLAVNARDAIEGPGRVTIETSNVVVDEEMSRKHALGRPGDYVLLAFSDTGMGMDAELLNHIFEPFFTTKGEGKGTGLGLSTVFGIVKQYDGFLHTYSEPGLGTTFKIYFPRFLGQAGTVEERDDKAPQGGNESVLIVEDEKQLLALAEAVLSNYGYRVMSAVTPSEALRKAREFPGDLHLLVTDMVLPEMNGKELQGKLLEIKPGVKTLFMSGYTANATVHRGMLEEGAAFLGKPFTINALAQRVRETLDS